MRYLKSFLVGLGMYLLAAYAYDVLGGLYCRSDTDMNLREILCCR
jgi:hypothetical protein